MTQIGFTISRMKDESRVALLPKNLEQIVAANYLFFQKGYAEHLGIPDQEYKKRGGIIVPRKELSQLDILMIPKRDKKDIDIFRQGQTLMGWLYTAQSPWLYQALQQYNMTAIAFEKMYSNGVYLFQENRDIAGQAGMLQALAFAGRPSEKFYNIAVLGRGLVAQGVFKVLNRLNFKYDVFHTKNYEEFFAEIEKYDMIISCIGWDPKKGDFIKSEDIDKMKNGCYLVDITSEGISGSQPQPIGSPVYLHSNQPGHSILIYNNEHTPTLWPLKSSESIGKSLVPLINDLITGKSNPILEKATVFYQGQPTDIAIKKTIPSKSKNIPC